MAVETFINDWGLSLGVGFLILFMVFIIWDLAKKSNAGKRYFIILNGSLIENR